MVNRGLTYLDAAEAWVASERGGDPGPRSTGRSTSAPRPNTGTMWQRKCGSGNSRPVVGLTGSSSTAAGQHTPGLLLHAPELINRRGRCGAFTDSDRFRSSVARAAGHRRDPSASRERTCAFFLVRTWTTRRRTLLVRARR